MPAASQRWKMTDTKTTPFSSYPPADAADKSIKISLHRRQASLSQYQTTCISKHYALNNQILAAFESHYRNGLYQVAYYLGLKFVETALLEIPKHGYFYSDKHAALRLGASVDALRVTHLLQEIVAKQPQQFATECHKIERLNHLAMEQYEHLGNYESKRKSVQLELDQSYPHYDPLDSSTTFTSTLLACGDSFSSVFCPGASSVSARGREGEFKSAFPEAAVDRDERKLDRLYPHPQLILEQEQRRHPFKPEARAKASLALYPGAGVISTASLIDQHDLEDNDDEPRDPQEEAKMAPPLLKSTLHARTQSDYDLQRALFLSGLQVDLPGKDQQQQQFNQYQDYRELGVISESKDASEPFAPPGAKKRESSIGLSMEMLSDCYHEDFDALRDAGRVMVSQVPTYQGRVPDSTNGCAVIAPLLCIHHFINDNIIPDPGLTDQIIVEVLDEETPAILPIVRQTLGLVKDAFLIPVDAHESLMEQQYMCKEQFLNVCGGNILEGKHLEPLLEQLSTLGPKKLAASFFFHEHVITILQLRRSDKTVWFDIIDSLPHEETLSRVGETIASEADGSRMDDTSNSLRLHSDGLLSPGSGSEDMVDHVPPPQAARIRCLDVESLKATLLWYACSVFTPENRAYIDSYQWDEYLSDFDPRVFQAFLWIAA
jgi:hypothetical protein